jgi:mechanosensitive ion channel-like protein
MQATVAVPVRDAGDAFRASLAGALNTLLSAIPRIIGFAVVLIVGWIISSLLARGVEALLHAVKFNDLARRSGFGDFVHKMGVRDDSSAVIASIVKWFVRLITLVVAFDTLGLPAVSNVLNQLLLWLPNLIVALVVLVIGGLAANALSRLVRGATAEAGFSNPEMMESVTKVAVWGFAIVVAITQLGIATTLINSIIIGLIGAMALAFGLAFGLGGRDRAAEILNRVGENARQAGPKLERAAEAARARAQSMAQQPSGMTHHTHNSMANGPWVERSQSDRRRVNRPGLQERRGDGSNGS